MARLVGSGRQQLSAPAYNLARVGRLLPPVHGVARHNRPRGREGARARTRKARHARVPGLKNAVELRTYIVEDNATIRENLIGTLEELACVKALAWAETESEARAWLAAQPACWDLAIVDLFLKQGSGLGVLEACRRRDARQRVVVLSNYATADMRQRCAQLGADAVFDKSNEIDALIAYCLEQADGGFSRAA